MHKSTKTPVLAALLATLLSGCRIVQLGIITVAAAVGLAGAVRRGDQRTLALLPASIINFGGNGF